MDKKALNGSLDVARPVPEIETFSEKHVLSRVGVLQDKFRSHRMHDAVLYGLQFQIDNLLQVILLQRSVHDHLIDAVHKLRRKLSPSRFQGSVIDFLFHFGLACIPRKMSRSKTDSA